MDGLWAVCQQVSTSVAFKSATEVCKRDGTSLLQKRAWGKF